MMISTRLYGVAYEMDDGWHAADLIGTKADAEKIVQDIADQKVVAFDAALRSADG